MAEANYPAKKTSIKDTSKPSGSGLLAKQADKRKGKKEKLSVSWKDKQDSEINFDSIATALDDYKPFSLEKRDFRIRKLSKALVTVPKPSFKYTPASSDEETPTLSKKDVTSLTPRKATQELDTRHKHACAKPRLELPPQSMQLINRDLKARKQSKALLTVPKPSYKYVSGSAPCSDEETLIDIASLRKKDNVIPIPLELDIKCKQDCVPIVYDEKYNIETTRPQLQLPSQPVQLNNPARVFAKIRGQYYKTVKSADIATLYDISEYVCPPLKKLEVMKVAEIMSFNLPEIASSPVTWKSFSSVVLRPLRYQMMGSVLACNLALEKGWAINIGGGFSHYTSNVGGGLAVYDDVLVCLAIISNLPGVKHIMVINVDAYQSPCYKYAKNINCPITIVDFYSEPIVDLDDASLTRRCNDNIKYYEHEISFGYNVPTSYMYSTLREISKFFLDEDFNLPSLCIYVAGSTVLAENPYTKMQFTTKHLVKRDEQVFKLLRQNKVPIAYLMSGGYQSYDVEASAAAISEILTNHCSGSLPKKSSGMPKKSTGKRWM